MKIILIFVPILLFVTAKKQISSANDLVSSSFERENDRNVEAAIQENPQRSSELSKLIIMRQALENAIFGFVNIRRRSTNFLSENNNHDESSQKN
ncbi:hypothetical protein EDEG_05101 [Edhazardia aedis USNM 41457]|uniref:Uncharacterized protein n=1 Tax=Edhazardia aedis (strain USNM 41457) TaxID=1003232 RepID=A0A0L1P6G0_EDHAE|nr:hypothetical protein EDEG_05101 [Edhazardia aedis USNM 41457]|eukprot:KNH48516.1 hypothetical protein EDEG_05101 [Edhazardia aedis USNM 41457]